MNLQQLEYIIAVDQHRHFAKAAESSFVTQPTLSMMIHKLERELDVKIFNRGRQPVAPTREGEEIILRARQIISEVEMLKSYTRELKGEISGELRLAIIPTLAPYLLPLFIKSFADRHPQLKLLVREMTTDEIIRGLRDNTIEAGILATPLNDPLLAEHPVFYEEFLVYAARSEKLPKKKYLLPKEINLHHLWLLEEGHCLRSQVINLCELKRKEAVEDNLRYEAGSIESLINLVDNQQGITIVPYLATLKMTNRQRLNLHEFAKPKPTREISLVTLRSFPRDKLLERLFREITDKLPKEMELKKKAIVPVGTASP